MNLTCPRLREADEVQRESRYQGLSRLRSELVTNALGEQNITWVSHLKMILAFFKISRGCGRFLFLFARLAVRHTQLEHAAFMRRLNLFLAQAEGVGDGGDVSGAVAVHAF